MSKESASEKLKQSGNVEYGGRRLSGTATFFMDHLKKQNISNVWLAHVRKCVVLALL